MRIFIFVLLLTCKAFCHEEVDCRFLGLSYNVGQLQEEVTIVEGRYMQRQPLQDYWTAIPLRNATGTDTREGIELRHTLRQHKMLSCKDSSFLKKLPYIQSILEDIKERFSASIGLVRLSKVPAKRAIQPHRDGFEFDLYEGSVYRLHIPIETGKDVLFMVSGKSYNLEPGNLYYTNVSKEHAVFNNGSEDRIHLIIDVEANALLQSHILCSPEVNPL